MEKPLVKLCKVLNYGEDHPQRHWLYERQGSLLPLKIKKKKKSLKNCQAIDVN